MRRQRYSITTFYLNIPWPQLNLKESMQSGFKKTGLFLFNNKIIRQTDSTAAKIMPPPVNVNKDSLFDEEQVCADHSSAWAYRSKNIDLT
ncbi:hypothetical protein BV898_03424 [Hypsibius exemplaris]|uniref:Uncharacterized protein n=1 Tax=Hypsibius exemplaris TaxID=2072580 RepID=A0A1W0X514_HYPEX|nr:hypothetical protein BV898_03424 [Hypsibius exemplaris]